SLLEAVCFDKTIQHKVLRVLKTHCSIGRFMYSSKLCNLVEKKFLVFVVWCIAEFNIKVCSREIFRQLEYPGSMLRYRDILQVDFLIRSKRLVSAYTI